MSRAEYEECCIECRDIEMNFGENAVLCGISLKLRKGEIFGLLGPSGAGKTTLIKILTGQLKQKGGQALLFGRDTGGLNSCDYTKIGMVLDNSGLYERLTCRDNLALFAQIYRISSLRIQEALKLVGLEDAAKRPVNKLSKGMRQRLVLARAVLHNPEVLFLDEPSSGLDPAAVGEIHRLILEQRDRGTTIFLTTHNMEEAAKLCDNVALLNQGSIVEYGRPGDICLRYNRQKQVRILLRTKEEVVLANSRESAPRISSYFLEEQVDSIHSTEPNLETVFLELTGRRFEG